MPMLTKIYQEERKLLVGTIQHLVHSIDNIEDDDLRQRICEQIIGLCDQMKSRMVISLVADKEKGRIIYETDVKENKRIIYETERSD